MRGQLPGDPRGVRAAFLNPEEVVLAVSRQLEVDIFSDNEVGRHAANARLEQWLTVGARPLGNGISDFYLRP